VSVSDALPAVFRDRFTVRWRAIPPRVYRIVETSINNGASWDTAR